MFCALWDPVIYRQAGLGGSGMSQPPRDSLSSSCQSEQLGAGSVNFSLHMEVATPALRYEELVRISTPQNRLSTEARLTDPYGSEHSLPLESNEVLCGIGLLPSLRGQKPEERTWISLSANEINEELQYSSPHHEPDDAETYDETCEKLRLALIEAENLKREAYEESRRCQKARRDLYAVKQRVKASESLHAKEIKQRKEIEERLAREKAEVEELRRQCNEMVEEHKKAHDRRRALELQVIDHERMIKDFEEKLSAAHHLLNSLGREHEELQGNREFEVREAEEVSTSTHGTLSFSEFSYLELQQATLNFDDSVKIGEDVYGTVYRGFIHHTTVAIKMFNPQRLEGISQFHQEVAVFSRLRHPNLVNLIGACPEACALVYEFPPNGSLEDHLNCKDNALPLTWQMRTRIATEVCTALVFLQSNSMAHGDLKPANILLDSSFVSKLSDSGIGRSLAQSNTTTNFCHPTSPQGTFSCMDPEFLVSKEHTPQSDVYSFGVILLRLLTGRPQLRLIKEVSEATQKGRLHEMLDASAGNWPYALAQQLVHFALGCCEIKRKSCPDLAGEAWRVLEPMMKAASSIGPLAPFRSASEDSCSAPSYFICPIFREIMRDPHIAGDGFTYECEAIKGWLDSGHEMSPMTNLKLPHREFVPNRALCSGIQEWMQHSSLLKS